MFHRKPFRTCSEFSADSKNKRFLCQFLPFEVALPELQNRNKVKNEPFSTRTENTEQALRPAKIKIAVLWRDSFFWGSHGRQSGGERSAAAAGAFGVRIIESEAAVIEATYEINFHAEQVNSVGFVHDDVNSVDFIPVIAIPGLVETKHIGKA
jgi:hypothetical protein